MKYSTGSRSREKAAPINYRCASCDFTETIPPEVLKYFDLIDPGLPGQPATFRCQKCPGIMYPTWWLDKENNHAVTRNVSTEAPFTSHHSPGRRRR